MKVAIIQYNAGNSMSVHYALQRIAVDSVITNDPAIIQQADKLVFPGVGHAAAAMQFLKERELDKLIIGFTKPVLGICLGMQLMCTHSAEGDTTCMGIFGSNIQLFNAGKLKVPQTGWNTIYDYRSVLFDGLNDQAFVYMVHSYYAALSADTSATTDYILPYSAALQKDNFYGVQFHPERSGAIGETILKNFIQFT